MPSGMNRTREMSVLVERRAGRGRASAARIRMAQEPARPLRRARSRVGVSWRSPPSGGPARTCPRHSRPSVPRSSRLAHRSSDRQGPGRADSSTPADGPAEAGLARDRRERARRRRRSRRPRGPIGKVERRRVVVHVGTDSEPVEVAVGETEGGLQHDVHLVEGQRRAEVEAAPHGRSGVAQVRADPERHLCVAPRPAWVRPLGPAERTLRQLRLRGVRAEGQE